MTNATTNLAVATETTAKIRGVQLPCPCCGEEQAAIMLSLADMESCRCEECSTDFTLTDVKDLIAKWTKVIAWVESAPVA